MSLSLSLMYSTDHQTAQSYLRGFSLQDTPRPWPFTVQLVCLLRAGRARAGTLEELAENQVLLPQAGVTQRVGVRRGRKHASVIQLPMIQIPFQSQASPGLPGLVLQPMWDPGAVRGSIFPAEIPSWVCVSRFVPRSPDYPPGDVSAVERGASPVFLCHRGKGA